LWAAVYVSLFRHINMLTDLDLERWPAVLGAALIMLMEDSKEATRKFYFSSVSGTVIACIFILLRKFTGAFIGFYGVMGILVLIITMMIVFTRIFPAFLNSIIFIYFSLSSNYAAINIMEQTGLRILTILLGGSLYLFIRKKIRIIPSLMTKLKSKERGQNE